MAVGDVFDDRPFRFAGADLSSREGFLPRIDSPMLETATSTSLLEGLADARNTAVWQAFVDRYRPLILRFVLRLGLRRDDAEDVAQATLMGFSESYRAGRYDRDRGRLRAWLFGIARNELNDWRARPRREVQVPDGDDTAIFDRLSADDELENVWNREWRGAVLRQCLQEVSRELKPQTVEAFTLFGIEGQSAEAVAERLGITANAVWLAKRRVLERIRNVVPMMEEIW